MENKNKAPKNWLDGRNEDLPDGFWESVEPHIPIYKRKRRMPIIFWTGIGLVLVGIMIFMVTDITKSNTIENKNGIAQSAKKNLVSGNETISILPSSGQNNASKNGIPSSIVEIEHSNQTQNFEPFFNKTGKNKIANTPANKYKTPKYYGHYKPNGITKTDSVDSDYNVNGKDNTLANEVENSIDNEQITQKKQTSTTGLDIEFLPLLKFGLVNKNSGILLDQKISLIKSANDRKCFTTHIGYNMILLHRSMTSNSTENRTFENRKKFERDYISHELFGDLMFRIHNKWSIGGGLRYTRIQELFDYDYQIIEGNVLQTITKTRMIEHTNTIDLIDIYGQVDYHFTLSNVRFTLSNAFAYNTTLNVKGLFLNETNELRKLEDAHFYKSNVGWSNALSLGIDLPIFNNISLGIEGGYRHYFQDWSGNDSDLQMRYMGFTFGSSIGYRF